MTIAEHPTLAIVRRAVVRSHCIGVHVTKRRHKESLNFFIKLGRFRMKSFKTRYLSSAVAAAVTSTLPTLVSAQDESADLEEVVVTGTRLTKSNVTSSVPLYRSVRRINSRGVARVEDVVNILPNVFVAQTAEVANGASGTSTLNLRGLGSQRTLVLIDGSVCLSVAHSHHQLTWTWFLLAWLSVSMS